MTPICQGTAPRPLRASGAYEDFALMAPTAATVAAAALTAQLNVVQLQQSFGFRHPGVQSYPCAVSVRRDSCAEAYDVSGLEAEPGFSMSYEEAVEAGRHFESTIRSNWSELDLDY